MSSVTVYERHSPSDEDMQKIAELDLGHSEIVDHGSPEFVKGLNSWKV